MHGGDDPFLSFLVFERARHAKRSRFAAVIAALIAVLFYQTQWLILRPGLAILLVGQACVALALFLKNAKLQKDLDRTKAGAINATAFPAWFEGEELFVKRLALFENACQMIGFAALGYGIWVPTRSLWLALAIGVAYPATAYLGITRKRNLKTIRQLRTGKEEVTFSGNYAGDSYTRQ